MSRKMPETRARKLAESGFNLAVPAGVDGMYNMALAHIKAAESEATAAERKRIVELILGGRFLHDEAPAARFAREVVAAIEREPQELPPRD